MPLSLLRTLWQPASKVNGALEIREVRARSDRREFVRLPYRIYASDSQWVPPLEIDVLQSIDPRKHPFYGHGSATQFLAVRGGQSVGRILVSDDPHYNLQQGTNLGCFGMFESVDDPLVAAGLLEAAAGWLRARGRTAIMGPIDYSTNYPIGLLIDGFDTPPRMEMNHQPPYYAALLEAWGLAKVKDLYAWWLPLKDASGWRARVDRLTRRGKVRIRPFNMKDFDAEVQRCQSVYNRARRDNWGFVPLTEAEFHWLAKRMARVAIPGFIMLAELDGETVGFSITLPDANEAIRPLRGRLTRFGLPIGALRLMYRLRRVRTARVLVLDLLESHRRRGIGELLILRTLDFGLNVLGYTAGELSWTLEDNRLINRAIEAVGARHHKTYRIYHKDLSPLVR